MFAVSFSNKADGSLQIGAGDTFLVKELTDRLLVMALLPTPINDAQALAIAVLKDDKSEVETALAKLIYETLGNWLEPVRTQESTATRPYEKTMTTS